MKVMLTDIPSEGREFDYDTDFHALGISDPAVELKGRIHAYFQLGRIENDVSIFGKLTGDTWIQCVRCLEMLSSPLDIEFQLNAQQKQERSATARGEERELHREDLNDYYFSGNTLDLTDVSREQVLLAFSGYPVCRPDCRGLCPQCGQNLNRTDCQCQTKSGEPDGNRFKEMLKRIQNK